MSPIPNPIIECLSIPGVFVNYVHIASLNGLYRVTFCEQVIVQTGEASQSAVTPRVSVVLPQDTVEALIAALQQFLTQITAMKEAPRAAGGLQ